MGNSQAAQTHLRRKKRAQQQQSGGAGGRGSSGCVKVNTAEVGERKLVMSLPVGTLYQVQFRQSPAYFLVLGDAFRSKDFSYDAEIMCLFAHPHLVEYLAYVDEPSCAGLLMHVMPLGTLEQYLSSLKGELQPLMLYTIAREIAVALAHLHSEDMVHGHLTASSIWVGETGVSSVSLALRVADYALSRKYVATLTAQMHVKGVPMHTAPELLLGEPLGPKADVYSFAMLLYRLAAGEAPTLPTSDEAQRSGSSSAGAGSSNMGWAAAAALIDGARPIIPPDVDPFLAELIHMSWEQQPDRRPDFATILDMLEWTETMASLQREYEGVEDFAARVLAAIGAAPNGELTWSSFSTLLLRVLPRLRPEDLQEVRAQLNSDGTSATAAAAEPVVTLEAFKTCLGRLFGLKFHTSAPLGSRKDRLRRWTSADVALWIRGIPALEPYEASFAGVTGAQLTALTAEALRDNLSIKELGPRKVFMKELSYLLSGSMAAPLPLRQDASTNSPPAASHPLPATARCPSSGYLFMEVSRPSRGETSSAHGSHDNPPRSASSPASNSPFSSSGGMVSAAILSRAAASGGKGSAPGSGSSGLSLDLQAVGSQGPSAAALTSSAASISPHAGASASAGASPAPVSPRRPTAPTAMTIASPTSPNSSSGQISPRSRKATVGAPSPASAAPPPPAATQSPPGPSSNPLLSPRNVAPLPSPRKPLQLNLSGALSSPDAAPTAAVSPGATPGQHPVSPRPVPMLQRRPTDNTITPGSSAAAAAGSGGGGLLSPRRKGDEQLVRVHVPAVPGASSIFALEPSTTAASVTQLVRRKYSIAPEVPLALVVSINVLSERVLADDELVLPLVSSWGPSNANRLLCKDARTPAPGVVRETVRVNFADGSHRLLQVDNSTRSRELVDSIARRQGGGSAAAGQLQEKLPNTGQLRTLHPDDNILLAKQSSGGSLHYVV